MAFVFRPMGWSHADAILPGNLHRRLLCARGVLLILFECQAKSRFTLRHRMRKTLLFQVITTLGSALADCSDPMPISVPITDVVLSNNRSRRGILAALGTPPQNISFALNAMLNGTWIWNSTEMSCPPNTTAIQCLTMRGGAFDTQDSKTFTFEPDIIAAGGDPGDVAGKEGFDFGASTAAKDTFAIGNASLRDFPVGMSGNDRQAWNRQANLGFGSNSTLLNQLKSSGQIASRSWSYWYGIDNTESRSAMDGQLVLGGYDAAKVVGQPYTQPLQNATAECGSGMRLSFTSMLMDFPNGTSEELSEGAQLTACVWIEYPIVISGPPKPYFWHFEGASSTHYVNRSLGLSYYSYVYSPTEV